MRDLIKKENSCLGYNLTNHFLEKNIEIYILDNFKTSDPQKSIRQSLKLQIDLYDKNLINNVYSHVKKIN